MWTTQEGSLKEEEEEDTANQMALHMHDTIVVMAPAAMLALKHANKTYA